MNEITRISAGVVFESDALAFVDQLAAEQQRNRSFIINAIIRYYARQLQQQALKLEGSPVDPKSNISLSPAGEMMRINF
jgi:hypothetical protein